MMTQNEHHLLPLATTPSVPVATMTSVAFWVAFWAYDLVQARTRDDRSFRMLTIIDEFTRECLAIDVARKLNHDDVLERLAWLMATRGVPAHIRSDNGSEFTVKAVRSWLKRVGVKTLYSEPGSPWGNGCVESFNGKLADELLEREVLDTLHETKMLTERWRIHYNTVRPHSASEYHPPAPGAWIIVEPDFATNRPPQQPQGTNIRLTIDIRTTHGEGSQRSGNEVCSHVSRTG